MTWPAWLKNPFKKSDPLQEHETLNKWYKEFAKDMKENYADQRHEIERLNALQIINAEKMNQLIELEKECNKQLSQSHVELIQLVTQNRDMREQIIFDSKTKNKKK